MPYCLPPERAVCGIRFQPIYSLAHKQIQAWEILSILPPDIQHERYFSSQGDEVSLNILCWQLYITNRMHNSRRCYFNIPARLLCRADAIERISKFLRKGIVIEIQDPQELISFSDLEWKKLLLHIQKIQSAGAEVWLDDIIPEHIPYFRGAIKRFDGVKIDKAVLHFISYGPDVLNGLVSYCIERVKAVLVEGIENSTHFSIAAQAGCQLLQGYMWPEERFALSYMPVSND